MPRDVEHGRLASAAQAKPVPRKCLSVAMRELVHVQGGQCGNQIGAKFWEAMKL